VGFALIKGIGAILVFVAPNLLVSIKEKFA